MHTPASLDDWNPLQAETRLAKGVVGSKTCIRCYQRAAHDAPWQAVTIDLAKA